MAEEACEDAMAQKFRQAYWNFAGITDDRDLLSERAYYDVVASEPHRQKRGIVYARPLPRTFSSSIVGG